MAGQAGSRTFRAQRGMEQGTYNPSGEKLDTPKWDSQVLDPTVNHYSFFTAGQGRSFAYALAGNKSIADTNIRGVMAVPVGQKFIVKALKFFLKFPAATLPTNAELNVLYNLLCESVLTFVIDGKDRMWEATVQSAMGLQFPVVQAAAGTNVATTIAMIRAAYPLNLGITLQSQTQFEIDLDTAIAVPASVAGIKLQIEMQGILKRLS